MFLNWSVVSAVTRVRSSRSLLSSATAALSMLTLVTAAFAHPKVTPEILNRFWPNAQTAVVQEIELSEAQEAQLVKLLGQPVPKEMDHTAYFAVTDKNNAPLGMLMNFDPRGFGMGVAVDRDRKKIVKAVIYKMQPGMPNLDVPTFLNQFAGKKANDAFKVGKDIKPVPGAEKESQAVATAVKASLLLAAQGFAKPAKPAAAAGHAH